MIAGGAPMDWDQPLIVHMMANIRNMTPPVTPARPSHTPRKPMMKFAADDRISPVAINFFMLQ